ncbi:flagellar hook-associated protein FlgK [Noviherbaspirillum galbum]|uniref:Flagellar hook-associated protein 1 n=1 Tax=Noviherbaspirillum galbum TaxID=2709383 RepID=A0A6B3SPC5_9BURK|nr:flagellar hook-associated protein FlgK [Noviherbaspirillum galbum]NEX62684.1 flagellar hook-associated protein FlgK [Noviherbaspirillum galbum]
MGFSILGVGQSALAAAQAGLATTAHNIANASTPGYSRQVVLQGSAGGQDFGYGFVGKGTQVADVRRVYDDLLTERVRAAQSSSSRLDAYYSQISQINNQFSDATTGLSPSLQDFFKGVQDLAANPNSNASRQSMLSSAEALASRFQSLNSQLQEVGDGINSQINATVGSINAYSTQIAQLNDEIEKAQAGLDGKTANDLLDQRDQAVNELSKQIKATVVKQGNSYNVFIGNGQPLVVGAKTFTLVAPKSTTDPSRLSVGIVVNGSTINIPETDLQGGSLGGLLEFRGKMLDVTQNALGRIAIGLGTAFNDQHALGQDQAGLPGGKFFNVGTPYVQPASTNRAATSSDPAAGIGAAITDASQLNNSNYRLQYSDSKYVITRMPENAVVYDDAAFPSTPNIIQGVTLSNTGGSMTSGDEFLIRPAATGAANFSVAVNDIARIAAAAPIRTASSTANSGTGSISAGSVNGPAPVNGNLQQPVTITFTSATTFDITGTGTGLPATGLSYTSGSDISYNGWTVQITGDPAANDSFSIGPNTGGVGDGRNAVALGKLQTANLLDGGTANVQGSYAQLVSLVGNKSHEVEVTRNAESTFLDQATTAQQAVSGVNLDEEATNLMRYQQAYQAAGKVMQAASSLFELLLDLTK